MKKIIFATSNEGKSKEVKAFFSDLDIEILDLTQLEDIPEIIEDGETYEENARKKAIAVFEKFNLPTIADDSGLSVDQLEGRPGVYSARYAGENCTYEDNNKKLIKELKGFQAPHTAQFLCCAVYLDEKSYFREIGVLNGQIIEQIRGKNGFGYDPVFLPDNSYLTLAEIDLELKNKISHRYKAFNKLKSRIIKEGKI